MALARRTNDKNGKIVQLQVAMPRGIPTCAKGNLLQWLSRIDGAMDRVTIFEGGKTQTLGALFAQMRKIKDLKVKQARGQTILTPEERKLLAGDAKTAAGRTVSWNGGRGSASSAGASASA